MELIHNRFAEGDESTISTLDEAGEGGRRICYILEDQYQPVKVPGETRIPPGRYRITLREDSPKFAHYYDRWDWYEGMPWLNDVPLFTYIYYHPGIDDDDSEGCGLTGMEYVTTTDGNYMIKAGTSRLAFERLCREFIYPAILERGEEVWVTVREADLLE